MAGENAGASNGAGSVGAPGTILGMIGTRGAGPALVDPLNDVSLGYDELIDRVTGLAGFFAAHGLAPGDCVAYSAANGPDLVVTFLAAAAAGLASAPLNPAYTEAEYQAYLADLRPDAILHLAGDERDGLISAGNALGIRQLPIQPAAGHDHPFDPSAATPESVALILHTSGTTSRPKGVPLRQANLTASMRSIIAGYRLSPDDVSYCVMPLFHIHGLVASTLSTLATGGTVVTPRRFSGSAFWADATRWGATWYSAVPTIHRVLLTRAEEGEGVPEHSLRFARSCSATLPASEWQRLEDLLTVPVVEAYGMTEASHQMATNPLPPGRREPGSVGLATAGLQVGIVDQAWVPQPAGTPGEVVVRGPSVIRAYRDNPEADAVSFRDGWFRTGDEGTLDSDGYLRLLGRIKEMINRGGEKISPYEVEAALQKHPSVVEAAAFGAPDDKYGEQVRVVVVLRDDTSPEVLRAHCAEHLAGFKVPERVIVLPAIPKGPTGKVQRRILSQQVGG